MNHQENQTNLYGLSSEEARLRLEQSGPNELPEEAEKSIVLRFWEQLQDPLIYVLLAAAVLSVLFGEYADAMIIGIVVVGNAFVGVLQEGKARRALAALKKLSAPHALVIRDGEPQEIDASHLVVGDLVCLEAGCQVPADLKLVQTVGLCVEESALTGENQPVTKDADFTWKEEEHIPLGDQKDRAFMSTMVTMGHGRGIVTATGGHTQIGKIASMLEGEGLTPLQKRLGDLGKFLSILSVGLCGLLFLVALLQHRNALEMLMVAVSLAVAAVPEGLPAVVTICLALSVTKMVKVNTIIRKLPSVETLGAVTVVCSDKTGTLTENRMSVECCYAFGQDGELTEGKALPELYQGMILCNDANLEKGLGDPTELALLDYGKWRGYAQKDLTKRMERVGEIPFDSDRKMMTTLHHGRGCKRISFTKGAPEVVLEKCRYIATTNGEERMSEYHRQKLQERLREMSGEALRTLAFAMYKNSEDPMEQNLTFLGLIGMQDPVRKEAVTAVERFRSAGVKTVMITGDYGETAFAIAKKLKIADNFAQCMSGDQLKKLKKEELHQAIRERNLTVFSRVSPAQKVEIVEGFQSLGEVVGMTGDGVNDAPSLKRADIGIAMGKNGTEVAKQAADMVLTDDNFATIEMAIEEGRGVYENIRKCVIFLLSSNLGEILTMLLAVIAGFVSPLKSSHILWVNLITDSLPALALGVDTNDTKMLMKNPPRKPNESLFARGGLLCTCYYGTLIAAISLLAFLLPGVVVLGLANQQVTIKNLAVLFENGAFLTRCQTYAFTVLSMSQLFHAIGMRDTKTSVFLMNHRENKWMLGAIIVGLGLQFAVTKIPGITVFFGTALLSLREWLVLLGLSAMPLLSHELIVLLNFIQLRIDNLQSIRRNAGITACSEHSGQLD